VRYTPSRVETHVSVSVSVNGLGGAAASVVPDARALSIKIAARVAIPLVEPLLVLGDPMVVLALLAATRPN